MTKIQLLIKLYKKIFNKISCQKNDKYVKFKNPYTSNVSLNFLEGFLEGLVLHKNINIVQVGAHDGDSFDPISKFCKKYNHKITIGYIEPQPDVFEMLKKNKNFLERAKFLNAAITEDGENLIIYRLKKKYWKYYKMEKKMSEHCWPTAIASSF